MKPKWYVSVEMRSKNDLSFNDVRSMLWDAVAERFGEGSELCHDGMFFSYVIFLRDQKYYRIPYVIVDGEVKLGEEEKEVEKKWVETRTQQAESDETAEVRVTLDAPGDVEGMTWEVTVIEPGFTLHRPIPWFFPDDVLRADAAVFEGIDVNLFDLPEKGASHVPDNVVDLKPYLVKTKAGWIDSVRHVAGQGVKAMLHFVDSYAWLGKNLLKAFQDGSALPYGLSIDKQTRAKMEEVEGKTAIRVTKIMGAGSVDIVSRPAAGGKFQRAVAAHDREEMIMDKKAIWEFIMRMRADLLEGKDFEKIEEKELRAIMDTMEPAQPAAEPDNPAADDAVALLRCEMALDKALGKSDLPEHSQKRVQTLFQGRVFEDDELTRAIADEKDYLAAHEAAMQPDEPVPASDIRVGIDTIARAQMAVDRAFGITQEEMIGFSHMVRVDNQPFSNDQTLRSMQDLERFDEVPAFSGLREMYTFFSGDPEVTGIFNRKKLPPGLRASMGIDSGTFSYVLGNTLGRRLLKAYNEVDFMEDLLISIRKSVTDFRTQEAVMVGYPEDLPDVDPESGDYQEAGTLTDEEATYSVGTKGRIRTVSRKTIINDDISVVSRIFAGEGRAARRTHAKYVWGFFIDNSNCTDGTAWFTSGHGNLGATALSIATALVGFIALGKMTEKDSGERIGWALGSSVLPNLVGPIDIIAKLQQVEEDEHYFSSNDLTTKTRNPLKGKVKANVIPALTDANDWGLLLPPSVADHVEMGYLNGRQEPEVFVADMPTSERMFLGDEIRQKIRHEYAGTPLDYRGGYKAQVT